MELIAFVVFVCLWMAAALSAYSEPRPRQAAVALIADQLTAKSGQQ